MITRMIKWIYNIWSEDRISAQLFVNRLQLNTSREWLPNRQLRWLGHLERMEENFRASKYKNSRLLIVQIEDYPGKDGLKK